MSYVFISYSRKDSVNAMKLHKLLEETNISAWIDTENITPGKEWRQEIDNAIRKAFAVVVVWTPNAISDYITYEWSFALGAGIEVIPLVFANHTMHARMSVLQHLRTQDQGWENNLIRRLVELNERYHDPHRLPVDTILVNDAELQLYIGRLRSDDDNDRKQAAHGLAELRDPRAIPALVKAMGFEDTKLYMIEAIGKIGHTGGIEPLLRIIRQHLATGNPLWSYRSSMVTKALQALSRIGEPAIPAMIKNLYIDMAWDTLSQTIIKMGRPALPYLIEAISNENNDIRGNVVLIIGQILKDDKSVPEEIIVRLANCLSDPDPEVASFAENSLQEIGSEKALQAITKHKTQK